MDLLSKLVSSSLVRGLWEAGKSCPYWPGVEHWCLCYLKEYNPTSTCGRGYSLLGVTNFFKNLRKAMHPPPEKKIQIPKIMYDFMGS